MAYVRVLVNTAGVDDYGCAVQYESGNAYEMDDQEADRWISAGIAESVTYEVPLPPQDLQIPRPLLTICVASLRCRHKLLSRLLKILTPQITGNVQLLIDIDDGDITIGEKRQRMLLSAYGEYICFVDDDDLVSRDYVAKIIKALETRPDCVGFKQKRLVDGKDAGWAIYSRRNEAWADKQQADGSILAYRSPCHLTPIRRELALAAGFMPRNVGEDRDYSVAVTPLCKTEVYIDEVLYFYELRMDRASETVNQR